MHGQPLNQDLNLLEDELLRIASSYYSELGGGAHKHASLLLSAVDYKAMAPGTLFIVPANLGVYPAGVIPAAQRLQQEADDKALIKQLQTCVGVAKGLKELIMKAIDKDFLLELQAQQTGYLNVTPFQMSIIVCDGIIVCVVPVSEGEGGKRRNVHYCTSTIK